MFRFQGSRSHAQGREFEPWPMTLTPSATPLIDNECTPESCLNIDYTTQSAERKLSIAVVALSISMPNFPRGHSDRARNCLSYPCQHVRSY